METPTGKHETTAVYCRVILDMEAIKKEEANYRELSIYYDFGDRKEEILLSNFFRINSEVQEMVEQLMPTQDTLQFPTPTETKIS